MHVELIGTAAVDVMAECVAMGVELGLQPNGALDVVRTPAVPTLGPAEADALIGLLGRIHKHQDAITEIVRYLDAWPARRRTCH